MKGVDVRETIFGRVIGENPLEPRVDRGWDGWMASPTQ